MSTPHRPAHDPPPYAAARDELDAILLELEGSDVDVDRLADRVARAAELIAICRDRIGNARLQIDEVIADLDSPERAGGAAPDEAP
jgi:exodeoxyribonuclease VII small subunit